MTGFFSSYLSSILAVGICTFICQTVCSSKNSEIKNAVAFISGLCMLITVFFPFCFGTSKLLKEYTFSEQDNFPKSESNTENSFYNLTATETETSIKNLIFSETGINVKDIRIELNEIDGSIKISHLSVILFKGDENSRDKIQSLLENIGFENITVKIEEDNHE